jgi:glutathione peroxidase-family protein
MKIKTVAEYIAEGDSPEILFWVGCAGSFDDRAKKVTKAVAKILDAAQVKFAVLGTEESCTGDPAKRAGNEFLFQMQAMQNIAVLNGYEIKKIVTACPHCFNTLKNEYPDLGGNYDVVHHSQLIEQLLNDGKIKVEGGEFKGKKIIVLNTASKCGYTPQYADWEKFHKENKDVVILGFPANEFGGQETGSNAEISSFCSLNYGVSFQMMEKVVVKGSGKCDLYQWLSDKSKNGWNEKEPSWNFCKYVINEKGELQNFFASGIKPSSPEFLAALGK